MNTHITSINSHTSSLVGEVLRPGDAGYDQARALWNGAVDRRPAFIVRCRSAREVAAAVRFAADHGLLLAVKGGGHSIPGWSVCEGGLMIDLSPMKAVHVCCCGSTTPQRRRMVSHRRAERSPTPAWRG